MSLLCQTVTCTHPSDHVSQHLYRFSVGPYLRWRWRLLESPLRTDWSFLRLSSNRFHQGNGGSTELVNEALQLSSRKGVTTKHIPTTNRFCSISLFNWIYPLHSCLVFFLRPDFHHLHKHRLQLVLSTLNSLFPFSFQTYSSICFYQVFACWPFNLTHE